MPKIRLLSQGFNRWGSMRKQIFNSSKLKKLRLLEGSDSPNPGTSYKQLGRFTFKKKGGKIC